MADQLSYPDHHTVVITANIHSFLCFCFALLCFVLLFIFSSILIVAQNSCNCSRCILDSILRFSVCIISVTMCECFVHKNPFL